MTYALLKIVFCLTWNPASCSPTPLDTQVVATYPTRAECQIAEERYNRDYEVRQGKVRYSCAPGR